MISKRRAPSGPGCAQRPDQDRLHHALRLDAFGQLVERALVDARARLVAAGLQLVEREAVRLAVGFGRRGDDVDDARAEERFQPHAETLRFLRRHETPLSAQSRGGQEAPSCFMLSIPQRKPIMATRVFVDGQEGTTGLRINEYLARRSDVEVLRAAPELRKDARERARLLNAADVAFLCLPDAAAREAVALVTNPSDLPDRREHRASHRERLGVRPARAGRRSARPHPRLEADRQPGLPLDRLHPARAAARRRRPGVVDGAAERDLDHRLLRRRQEDDRAVRSRRRPAPRLAAALRAQAQPQAPARDGGAQPARDGAGLHADRRQLPEGPLGRGAAAPGDAEARHVSRAAARGLERALRRRALRSRHAARRRVGARPTATSTSRRATTPTTSTCSCSRARPRRS